MKPHIRVESSGIMGYDARIFYVDREGNETDISNACRGVSINLDAGDVTTAKLDMFLVPNKLRADLVEVVVTDFKPRRRWLRRLREITTIGQRTRWYA